MKTYIERTLERIMQISYEKCLWLSTDIYYNDLAVERKEQFVVKVHSGITDINQHFRSNHIRKSLKMALDYVKGL